MDDTAMVILVAIYFLFLIICYFDGERQGAGVWIEYVQMSHEPEWTENKTWEQDRDVSVSKMTSSLLVQMQRGYVN